MIKRKEYLEKLINWKDKNIIKVITGIRRCGKSTLLKQYKEYLLNSGIDDSQIIFINLEDLEYEKLLDYQKLYNYILSLISNNKKYYVFLDEIQKVRYYEKVVDSLNIKDNIDIYITGSNSYMFSYELATYLSGRYVELSLLPLSFKEFYSISNKDKTTSFKDYMVEGGFPYISTNLDEEQNKLNMEDLYNTLLINIIEERLIRKERDKNVTNITDILLLKNITKYLSSVLGSPISIRNISNYLTSNDRKISPNTVSAYISALSESYLFYPVEPINISGKEILKSNKKYYIVDTGLRNFILPKSNYDLGFTIENIVYLELKRRNYIVNIGKNGNQEVDFVVKKNGIYTYIQVSATLLDEATFNREIRPLKEINDNYDKIILTLDEYSVGNYDGIKVINVIDWLLSE